MATCLRMAGVSNRAMRYQVRRPAARPGEYAKVGEFGFEELQALHRAGVVKGTDEFAIEGRREWIAVGSLFATKVSATTSLPGDPSRETRGRDSARGTKIFGTVLAIIGTLGMAFDPGVGFMALLSGLIIFIIGRFQE